MKRILALLLFCAVAFALTSCSTQKAPEDDVPVEVTVFAAASLEASLTEIQSLYMDVAPNVTLTFNFDSSGTLRTQIKEGAVCDLLMPDKPR